MQFTDHIFFCIKDKRCFCLAGDVNGFTELKNKLKFTQENVPENNHRNIPDKFVIQLKSSISISSYLKCILTCTHTLSVNELHYFFFIVFKRIQGNETQFHNLYNS